ncbi:hypothetical protein SDC9_194456 [bioreactor metagenome]|uniref:Uncharacterized protein n=1 Tax=bioreactor metagenome TaxID=1076179 RepID=A0A645I6A1_9ZZZZ
MPGEDVLDDGQTEAGATAFPRTPPIHAVKALGQAGNVRRIDTDAGIPYRKHRTLGVVRPHQLDTAALRGISHRIARQVGKGAMQLFGTSQKVAATLDIERHLMAPTR